jgi:hypothetical protein
MGMVTMHRLGTEILRFLSLAWARLCGGERWHQTRTRVDPARLPKLQKAIRDRRERARNMVAVYGEKAVISPNAGLRVPLGEQKDAGWSRRRRAERGEQTSLRD